VVDRDDSIILTLPSGDHQLQRFSRRASFLMKVSDGGDVTITLDSLVVKPRTSGDAGNPVGAVWTGEVAGDHLNALQLHGRASASAAPLTTIVRELLPRLPRSGARAGLSWADTSNGQVQVDIFSGSERRTATWSAGPVAGRDRLLPVSVHQEFEQLGSGAEGGQKMSMTSQGRSSGVYYIQSDGRITDAQLSDSVTMLISIPGTRQLIPTTRYSRTSVHFFSQMRGQSD
jgi:hypothetical protein